MKHWSKNEKKRGTWHPAMVETWNHWNSETVASSGFHVYFRKSFLECMFMFVLRHAFFHRNQQKLILERFFPSVVFGIVSHPLRFYFSAGVKLDKNSIWIYPFLWTLHRALLGGNVLIFWIGIFSTKIFSWNNVQYVNNLLKSIIVYITYNIYIYIYKYKCIYIINIIYTYIYTYTYTYTYIYTYIYIYIYITNFYKI